MNERDTPKQRPEGGGRRRRRRAALLALVGAPVALLGAAGAALLVRSHGDPELAAKTAYRALKSARDSGAGEGRAVSAALKAAVAGSPAQAAAAAPIERADAPLRIYDGGLAPDWQDWSWAEHDIKDKTVSRKPGGTSIRMTAADWKGVYLHHDAPIGVDGYGAVELFVKGQRGKLTLTWSDTGSRLGKQVTLEPSSRYATRAADGWVAYRVPLADIGVELHKGWDLKGFAIQDAGGNGKAPLYIDGVSLLPDPSLPAAPTAATVAVTVDASGPGREISPLIYGMSFAPKDYVADLRLTVNRWGGNDRTRYNWRHGNASNSARDWEWRNRKAVGELGGPAAASSAADWFVRTNREAGAETMLTVPTIGWVAKGDDNNDRSENVPNDGGPPVGRADGPIAGYDPTENRRKTSVRSVAREQDAKPGEVAQDAWVRHLVSTFGAGGRGGVRFYAMDNEPDLWQHTHTDVHPARMGYDDLLDTFYTYASAVKDADPSAQITGPVSWGWTGYLYSPLDQGSDNYHTHADRNRHGGNPFLLWFLKQVKARDDKAGRRTLDVLDVHFYPQGPGLYSNAADQPTRERRIRSVRALFDPAYSDESWIGEPVRLIPRLKEWVAQGYPGTKIGITEWNFGADPDISGALSVADALGIFGREGVYLANYWAFPGKNTPGYLAFKLMRNADGAGHGFGDRSLPAATGDFGRVSCYASRDAATGDLTLLLLNKMRKATVTAPVTLKGSVPAGAATKRYTLSAAAPGGIVAAAGPKVGADGKLTVSLPPYSLTLVRVPKGAPTR